MTRAKAGDPGRLWVVAESQSGGRGRNGRVWSSPPGNLYASLLLIDPAPPRRAPELGFVAGVALASALRGLLLDDQRLAIKWPNDILHDGAKLAGILLEAASLPDGRFACVAGIGVNCSAHPDVALYEATNLAAVSSRPISAELVFEHLSAAMAKWIDLWACGDGFETVRAKWLSLAFGIGEKIRVVRRDQSIEGVFKTIDPSGRLIVAQEPGDVAVDAGDVFSLARSDSAAAAGQSCAPPRRISGAYSDQMDPS